MFDKYGDVHFKALTDRYPIYNIYLICSDDEKKCELTEKLLQCIDEVCRGLEC